VVLKSILPKRVATAPDLDGSALRCERGAAAVSADRASILVSLPWSASIDPNQVSPGEMSDQMLTLGLSFGTRRRGGKLFGQFDADQRGQAWKVPRMRNAHAGGNVGITAPHSRA